ncbi:MAG: FG-GAP-like repeat-containing protein [Planctomycetes bacterium]|nr:FG-GAP-like repeat-containing protein [Planctomycetota bacterium]
MRAVLCSIVALLGLESAGRGQPFGFTHRMFPTDTDHTLAVALGDVDGDGDLDAIFGDMPLYSPGRDRLYRNDGVGIFADVTASNLPAVLAGTVAVALGDMDGDGDLDAILGNGGGGTQDRLFANNGAGLFSDVTATSLPVQVGFTLAVSLGDVDGDGDLDALLGTGGQDRLLLNNGLGAFTDVTAAALPSLLEATPAVALGDVDGDGDLDAFLGNWESPGVSDALCVNNGTGGFTDVTATNLPAQLDLTTAVALEDLDGDGDLDAFLGNGGPAGGQCRVYVNDGTGVFSIVAGALPGIVDDTEALALGDADGDGDLDGFLGNAGPPFFQNRLYLNDGTGVFTDSPASLPSDVDETRAVALGDVDGDGDLDALLGNGNVPSRAQDRLYLNDGGGVFADVTPTQLPGLDSSVSCVEFGDVDGDGDLDALVGKENGSAPGGPGDRLYLNDGTGFFTDVTLASLPLQFVDTLAVGLGDVDGDGDLDAFLGRASFGSAGVQDALYLNYGSGSFSDASLTSLPAVFDTTLSVALGDVDGDGDLDALLGSSGGWPSRLYVNAAIGVFTDATATNMPALTGPAPGVALGDLDGDGDLDAYLGTSGVDRLYLNNGTGVFTDGTWTNLPGFFDPTQAVALGDVDGDGDLDVFAGNGSSSSGAQSRLYLNGGTGVFADATSTNLPVLLASTFAVALGDIEGDGDLDAFLGNLASVGAQNRLYLNSGTGVFTDVTASELPPLVDATWAVALGDVDGDGDLDAFSGNSDQESRICTNLLRQVSWRGTPRIGKSLTLDLWGTAGGTWLLGAAAGGGSLPVPSVGTLWLELPTLFIVAGGALDAQGRASLSFVVPANPALLGGSLYWQAVVGWPLRFTNLEVTTVTNL